MACPAAERAPEAPKVQKMYRAESAGIARPDVIDVVLGDVYQHEKSGVEEKEENVR
jgi:hypothetical protein